MEWVYLTSVSVTVTVPVEGFCTKGFICYKVMGILDFRFRHCHSASWRFLYKGVYILSNKCGMGIFDFRFRHCHSAS